MIRLYLGCGIVLKWYSLTLSLFFLVYYILMLPPHLSNPFLFVSFVIFQLKKKKKKV